MIKKIILVVALFYIPLFSDILNIKKLKIGERIYKETCISCHDKDGKANINMYLTVKPRDLTLSLLNEIETYKIIKDGAHFWGAKSSLMPSFKTLYYDEELRAVAYYVHNVFNKNLKQRIDVLLKESEKEPVAQDKKMLKWGKKIFNRNCKYCHGKEGKGDGIATKNPVDSIFPYDLTKTLLSKKKIFLYIKYGGKHFGSYNKDMPSWKRKYNDFKIHSVSKYVDEKIRKTNRLYSMDN
jgi:mono/diheme cytochrome c family protein